MRNPIHVLKSLEEKASVSNNKYERLYRNLYNPEFYLLAYANIAKSQGSMTQGVDGQTLDNMSLPRINRIIESIRNRTYQPKPAKRKYIPKKNGKLRPLGITSTDDKLVQEVVRMILEAIYEPTFSNNSHGFRPKRSCHTALTQVKKNFTGVTWIVEGDIKACFDNFDHHVLVELLRKRISDEAFIGLIWKFLKAGYMEQWQYNCTYSGVPQGSGISPICANIYLSELDNYMQEYKEKYDCEPERRRTTREYERASRRYRKARKALMGAEKSTPELVKEFKDSRRKKMNQHYYNPFEEGFKKIQYNRYADDFVIGVIGSKKDAEKIKEDVKIFLQEKLHLEMSEEKTKVTHSSKPVRYLGYDFKVIHSKNMKRCKNGDMKRVWYGKVFLYMPKEKWIAKLHEYGAFKIKKDENGKEIWKPLHRGALMPLDDVAIISKYNSEIRGLYNYYRLAINVCNLGKFHSIMRGSCLKTLAAKYNSSVMKMYKKYRSVKGDFGADYKTKSGTKRCEFYNEGFRRNNNIAPEFVDIMPKYRGQIKPNSLAGRLKSGQCEMCGANPVKVYMHHVKRLKDLNADNEFDELMLLKRRKSLALCPKCYEEAKTKSLKL